MTTAFLPTLLEVVLVVIGVLFLFSYGVVMSIYIWGKLFHRKDRP
jgi:hypothetical protein